MKFIDKTEIHVKSGDGGDGIASFKAAKNLPKLGADGGDGGTGGHVILEGNNQLNTLSCFRYRHYYKAEDGRKGGSNGKTGACGKPLVLKVPVGTIVHDRETGEKLAEITQHGEQIMVVEGGYRGLGNMRYVSSIRQAPEKRTLGKKGATRTLQLELKLMADVGLAGFPNAGKSSLLSVLSSARPRIADYPFTTLVPQLGVVDFAEEGDAYGKSFVMADIPGLIEGAAEGRGLGHDFLKHLERTKILAYVVEVCNLAEDDPVESYLKIKHEIDKYGELNQKKSLIVLSKIDLVQDDHIITDIQARFAEIGMTTVFPISSTTRQGLSELKFALYELIQEESKQLEESSEEDLEDASEAPSFDESWLEDQGFTLLSKSDFFSRKTDGDQLGKS